MWILDSMGDTLVFTWTRIVKYFSIYGPLFALPLKINFLERSAFLENHELTTDINTSTDELSLLQYDIKQHNNFYVEWWCIIDEILLTKIMRRFKLTMHFLLTTIIFLIPNYNVAGQIGERRVETWEACYLNSLRSSNWNSKTLKKRGYWFSISRPNLTDLFPWKLMFSPGYEIYTYVVKKCRNKP